MLRLVAATVAALAMTAHPAWAQSQPKMTPTVPGAAGDPVWQGVVRLSDGRAFVTDGGLAIDAAIAKPAALPTRELPGKVLQDYINAAHKDEHRLTDLTRTASGTSYATPTGATISATYVNFLRRVLPVATVRLRASAADRPVIIMANGKAVGVLMPVRQ